MEKCDITACILYEEREENNCMEYGNIGEECYKFKHKRLKTVAQKLAEALKELKDELHSAGFWEMSSDAERIYSVIDNAESTLALWEQVIGGGE